MRCLRMKTKKLATELQTICDIKQCYVDNASIWDNLINDEEIHIIKLPYTTPEEQEIIDEAREKLANLYTHRMSQIAAELTVNYNGV